MAAEIKTTFWVLKMQFIMWTLLLLISFQISRASTLSTNLVAHYTFDGNADDISGNNNHGTVYSATLVTDRFGTASSAYAFNGGNSYIEIANGNAFNFANHFTISVWLKAGSTQMNYATLFDKSHGSGGWTLYQNYNAVNSFQFGHHTTSSALSLSGIVQFDTSIWIHLVIIKEATAVYVYKNNALQTTGNPTTSTIFPNGIAPLIIGSRNSARS